MIIMLYLDLVQMAVHAASLRKLDSEELASKLPDE